MKTWRSQSINNGCPNCRHPEPTQIPLLFAGVKDFMTELKRVPFLVEINSIEKVKPITGSPTYVLTSSDDAEDL